MKTFNAFQAVLMFAAWPLLMQWLYNLHTPAGAVGVWISGIAYLIGFITMICCVRQSMD